MEAILIIVIAVGVAAAVAYPLVRGGGTGSDPHLDPDPSVIEATDAKSAGAVGSPAVEAEIMRTREALHAGTVCPRCAFANAPDSRFCSECGSALARDADTAAGSSTGTVA